MQTAYILLCQYQTAIIPASRVAKDYFQLSSEKFLRKIGSGEIKLPLIRLEESQKSARGIHVSDLARYLDQQRSAAIKVAGMETP